MALPAREAKTNRMGPRVQTCHLFHPVSSTQYLRFDKKKHKFPRLNFAGLGIISITFDGKIIFGLTSFQVSWKKWRQIENSWQLETDLKLNIKTEQVFFAFVRFFHLIVNLAWLHSRLGRFLNCLSLSLSHSLRTRNHKHNHTLTLSISLRHALSLSFSFSLSLKK